MLGDLTDRSYTDATENIPPHAMLLPGLMATDMTCPPVTLSDGRTGYVVTVHRTASTRAYAVAAVDFSDINRWRPASHNGCTFLSGGLLSYLSTDRVQEASFLQTPENLTATDTGSLTGPTGDVSYVAVFEGRRRRVQCDHLRCLRARDSHGYRQGRTRRMQPATHHVAYRRARCLLSDHRGGQGLLPRRAG